MSAAVIAEPSQSPVSAAAYQVQPLQAVAIRFTAAPSASNPTTPPATSDQVIERSLPIINDSAEEISNPPPAPIKEPTQSPTRHQTSLVVAEGTDGLAIVARSAGEVDVSLRVALEQVAREFDLSVGEVLLNGAGLGVPVRKTGGRHGGIAR
jgi:hypothetical protein